MFLKLSVFKKIIKEAYKGPGLTVGAKGEGVFLEGRYWVIWLKRSEIPKKALAAIIELTGELPEEGEVFEATESGNQYELSENSVWDINEAFESANVEYSPMRILYQTDNKVFQALQQKCTGKAIFINNKFMDLIDLTEMEAAKETMPIGPVARTEGEHMVYWKNNVCTLAACLINSESEREIELLRLLSEMKQGGDDDD